MRVSVILVSYNTAEMSKTALQHLYQSKGSFELEVFVIDNASKDNSAQIISAAYPQVTMIANDVNVGFGRANNQALPQLTGEYVLLLNTDAFIEPDAIQKSLDYMQQNPKTGILGAKLIGRDGELQPSCRYFPTPWNLFLLVTGYYKYFPNAKMVDDLDWDHNSARQCDWVPGCYYLIRKAAIDQAGLFDPRYFLYYEEVDHCYATKQAGWDVVYFPGTTVVHIGGESAKNQGQIKKSSRQIEELQVESELLYFRKNHGLMGVLQDVGLHTLADVINITKNILKLNFDRVSAAFSHIVLNFRMLWKTRMGKIPTR